jgi:alpha-tubulin suppressor-like RCC1 family protein
VLGTWGQSALGPKTPANIDAPFLVGPSTTLFGSAMSRVATQQDFTCVDQANGTVQSVGENTDGQLGFGIFGQPADKFTPKTVDTSVLAAAGAIHGTLHGVSTGVKHACALDDAGQALCWRDGQSGKLGVGIGNTSDFATPQLVAGGLTFRAIAAGWEHTCAIATTNQIFCGETTPLGRSASVIRTGSARISISRSHSVR